MMRLRAFLILIPLIGAACAQAQPTTSPALPGVDLGKTLTLDDLVRLAIANNPVTSISVETVKRADAAVVQARAAQLPDLGLGADVRQTKLLGGPSGGRSSRDLSLTLSETFYQSGLREQIEAARAGARAARFGDADTHRTLILSVAQSYFTALASVGLAEVAMRAVAASQQHLDLSDARIARGVAARADRYPFEVELAQARLTAISADNTAKTSLTNLKRAIGLASNIAIKIAPALTYPSYSGKLPELLQTAYDNRPDIKQAQEQAKQARQSLRIAEIQAGPVLTVDGTADYGYHTGQTGDAWQVSAGVSVPIFDSGRSRAAVDSAAAAFKIAQENLRSTQLDISAEVERNFLNVTAAEAGLTAADAALKSAQVSLGAAQEKYANGVGTVIDVTDAETKLEQSDADQVKAKFDYNTSLAALKASVGRLDITVP